MFDERTIFGRHAIVTEKFPRFFYFRHLVNTVVAKDQILLNTLNMTGKFYVEYEFSILIAIEIL